MKHILSIQSHVAYGYVGNRAAVFPLQRLGYDVTVINTVQFSNHTGYQQWRGQIFDNHHIKEVYQGLVELNTVEKLDALLTGYLGSADIGQSILDIIADLEKREHPFFYCCDPVIGDEGRGVFVRPGVGEFFKTHLVPKSTILTPNIFELAYLTDRKVRNLFELRDACLQLVESGPRTILVTSVLLPELKTADQIGMFLYTKDGAYLVTTPYYHLTIPPNGAGDATAALFLGHYLESSDFQIALLKTARALQAIFKMTHEANTRELQLIASQNSFYGNANVEGIQVEKIF